MANIKALDRINAKWQRVTAGAGAEYEEGVRNPTADWKSETLKANASYKAGVQKSISLDSFAKGVDAAGTAKWQKNAIEKGPARFAQGVSLAVDAYSTGFAPYRQVISALTLPPRGPKGDASNINRVAVVAKALHDKKLAGGK
jgi:hypothetical protein